MVEVTRAEALGTPMSQMRLSYSMYKQVVDRVLFEVDDALLSDIDSEGCLQLTESEKEAYFSHPFLSPRSFLAFVDDRDKCVAAVPLFTYIAQKLLLYNLRAKLELAASVAPPSSIFATVGGARQEAKSRVRVPISRTSPLSNAMTQEDLEGFIASIVPNLRLVRDLPVWLLPYYLCHASAKFMFMLDLHQSGCVSIDAVMKSDIFSELLRLYETDENDARVEFPAGTIVEASFANVADALARAGVAVEIPEQGDDDEELVRVQVEKHSGTGSASDDQYVVTILSSDLLSKMQSAMGADAADPSTQLISLPRECLYWCEATTATLPGDAIGADSWFAAPIMYRVYQHYTSLDADGDGMLSESEMRNYNDASFTHLAVARVFEVHTSGTSNEFLDYKRYLDFVVATEHPGALQSVKYFWKLLDLHDTHDFIHVDVLRCFCREVAARLGDAQLMTITGDSILAEIIDMINPADHEKVTFGDLTRSNQHGTVLPLMLDFRNFYAYDCREQTAAHDSNQV